MSKLEKNNLITSVISPKDKRHRLINLTEQGRAEAIKFAESRKGQVDELFSPLTHEEQNVANGLLKKLLNYWEKSSE